MRRKVVWAGSVTAAIIVSCAYWWSTTGDPPADDRARTYFAIPADVPVDSVTLRTAVLRLVPLGTPESEVRARLARAGIGADRLSSYYPPDSKREAVVRIETGQLPSWVVKGYGIGLAFDSTGALRDVRVYEWLTGL